MTSKESRSSLLELNGEVRPLLGVTLLDDALFDDALFLDTLGAGVGTVASLVAFLVVRTGAFAVCCWTRGMETPAKARSVSE